MSLLAPRPCPHPRRALLSSVALAISTLLFGCALSVPEEFASEHADAGVDDPLPAAESLYARPLKVSRSCGNGKCRGQETCSTCPQDCGVCTTGCGDATCDAAAGEDCASCEQDCGTCAPTCGDASCDAAAGEDCASCEQDCGTCAPTCGDATCDAEAGEDCASCEQDCGTCGGTCGDTICDGNGGESCTACASDCQTRDGVCGNGECAAGETSASCFGDCGPNTWSPSWASDETEVLDLINAHRAAGTDCPTAAKSPVGPLAMNSKLRTAARLHSWDQSYSGYFSHTSCNGRSPWERATAAGTSASGETIGLGYGSPSQMVAGWMASPGHCNILMGGYSEVGVGYAQEGSRLWTAIFR